MRTRRNDETAPTPLWAFALVLVLGVAMVGMVRLAMAANTWGPGVGDIIRFAGPAPELAPRVRFRVTRVGPNGGSLCRLDSKLLRRAGGSLIVESAAQPELDGYLVHWAGHGPTSAGADCGARAELRVSAAALGSLATAAGGFGVTHRTMLPLLGGS